MDKLINNKKIMYIIYFIVGALFIGLISYFIKISMPFLSTLYEMILYMLKSIYTYLFIIHVSLFTLVMICYKKIIGKFMNKAHQMVFIDNKNDIKLKNILNNIKPVNSKHNEKINFKYNFENNYFLFKIDKDKLDKKLNFTNITKNEIKKLLYRYTALIFLLIFFIYGTSTFIFKYFNMINSYEWSLIMLYIFIIVTFIIQYFVYDIAYSNDYFDNRYVSQIIVIKQNNSYHYIVNNKKDDSDNKGKSILKYNNI